MSYKDSSQPTTLAQLLAAVGMGKKPKKAKKLRKGHVKLARKTNGKLRTHASGAHRVGATRSHVVTGPKLNVLTRFTRKRG